MTKAEQILNYINSRLPVHPHLQMSIDKLPEIESILSADQEPADMKDIVNFLITNKVIPIESKEYAIEILNYNFGTSPVVEPIGWLVLYNNMDRDPNRPSFFN